MCIRKVQTTFACPACDYTTCTSCVKRFIVDYAVEPACMNCSVAFDRDTLLRLSRSFVDGPLKCKREKVLVDRELAMMPSTQNRALRERERRRIGKLIEENDAMRDELSHRLHTLKAMRRALVAQHASLAMTRHEDEQDRRAFVQACAWEGCRGFVSKAYKCGTCNRRTCRNCNAPVRDDEKHVCNPDDIASVELIRSKARKCPCGELIEKISGCDQMWCPTCKTAWSWRTGLAVTEQIHNPHWYEYQRTRRVQVGRDPRDIPCGDRPTIVELLTFMPNFQELSRWFSVFHRLLAHMDALVESNAWARRPVDDSDNIDLRVQYMLGDFDVDCLKRKLQQREKKRLKARDTSNVWELLTLASSDILRGMLLDQTTDRIQLLQDKKRELINLVNFSNENASAVGRRYKCVVKLVTNPSMNQLDY